MNYSYPRGYLALKDYMKGSGVKGHWKLCQDGKHRQFRAESGEILNYRDDSKTIWFQGCENGPLHEWFASARVAKPAVRRKPKRRTSPTAALQQAQPDRGGADPKAPITRTPALPPEREGRRAASDGRRQDVADMFMDVTHAAAAAELIYAGVCHASADMDVFELHTKLCAVARVLMHDRYWPSRYTAIEQIFRITIDDED